MPRYRSSKDKSRSERHSKRSKEKSYKRYSYRRSPSPPALPLPTKIKTKKNHKKRVKTRKHPEPAPVPRRSALWDQAPSENTLFSQSNTNSNRGENGAFYDPTNIKGGNKAVLSLEELNPGSLLVSKDGLVRKEPVKVLLIGNLNPETTSDGLKSFLDKTIKKINEHFGVRSAMVNRTHRTAYVGASDEKCAVQLLKLNGIEFDGYNLAIQRLTTRTIASSALLAGSDDGTPPLMVSVPPHVGNGIGGGAISRHVPDGPGKIFCAGIPIESSDAEVQDLLASYGNLDSFFMPQDANGKSKGFCFFKYADLKVTNEAIRGLNGIVIDQNVLTVKLHEAPNTGDPAVALRKAQEVLMAAARTEIGAQKSRVLVMLNMLTLAVLKNDSELKEVLADIRGECKAFGKVISIEIPRPGKETSGIGKVFVKYSSVHEAKLAKDSLQGRSFDNQTREEICEEKVWKEFD